MGILIPIILIVVTSIVIWKSSDGFDVASSYLGRNLFNGVKGAPFTPLDKFPVSYTHLTLPTKA